MGWSLGWDNRWKRDIGYGVPAYCDHPKCNEEIDRGLSYVCGGEPYGGEHGCGLYFCEAHLVTHGFRDGDCRQVCWRCGTGKPPYKHPKSEHPTWILHKLTDPSWEEWRREEPKEVERLEIAELRDALGKAYAAASNPGIGLYELRAVVNAVAVRTLSTPTVLHE